MWCSVQSWPWVFFQITVISIKSNKEAKWGVFDWWLLSPWVLFAFTFLLSGIPSHLSLTGTQSYNNITILILYLEVRLMTCLKSHQEKKKWQMRDLRFWTQILLLLYAESETSSLRGSCLKGLIPSWKSQSLGGNWIINGLCPYLWINPLPDLQIHRIIGTQCSGVASRSWGRGGCSGRMHLVLVSFPSLLTSPALRSSCSLLYCQLIASIFCLVFSGTKQLS